MSIAVVVPAFGAAATVTRVVRDVVSAVPAAAVVVGDDGSRDRTADRAREAGARVLAHDRNRGKGSALRTGILDALDAGAGIIATLDADGQHDASSLPR